MLKNPEELKDNPSFHPCAESLPRYVEPLIADFRSQKTGSRVVDERQLSSLSD